MRGCAEGGSTQLGADSAGRLTEAELRDIVLFEKEQIFVDDLAIVFNERAVFGYPFEELDARIARQLLSRTG